jgi:hypothetical protein
MRRFFIFSALLLQSANAAAWRGGHGRREKDSDGACAPEDRNARAAYQNRAGTMRPGTPQHRRGHRHPAVDARHRLTLMALITTAMASPLLEYLRFSKYTRRS